MKKGDSVIMWLQYEELSDIDYYAPGTLHYVLDTFCVHYFI